MTTVYTPTLEDDTTLSVETTITEVDEYKAPEGYRFTGEFRQVKPGELYLSTSTRAEQWELDRLSGGFRPILKKIVNQKHWWEFEPGVKIRVVNAPMWNHDVFCVCKDVDTGINLVLISKDFPEVILPKNGRSQSYPLYHYKFVVVGDE